MRTTGIQVSGAGFLLRRIELALVIGDPRMAHDPLRTQRRAIIVGILASLLIAGGSVMLALLRPQPDISDSNLVADETGSLYVRLSDGLHPVTNVASARLLLGAPEEITRSTAEQVTQQKISTPVGIPHVPGLHHAPTATWMHCEDTNGTQRVVAAPQQKQWEYAILRTEIGLWFIHDDTRYKVEDTAARALGLEEISTSEAFARKLHRGADVLLPQGDSGLARPFHEAGRLIQANNRVFIIGYGGITEITGARKAYVEAFTTLPAIAAPLAEVLSLPEVRTVDPIPSQDIQGLSQQDIEMNNICISSEGLAQPQGLTVEQEHELRTGISHSGFPHYIGPRGSAPLFTERGIFLVSEAGERFSVGSEKDLLALGFDQNLKEVRWEVIEALPEGGLLSENRSRKPAGAASSSDVRTARE